MCFIPHTEKELLEKMQREQFTGQLAIKDAWLIWRLPNQIVVNVLVDNGLDGYIGVYLEQNGKEISITHWHPSADEIYGDLFQIHTGQLFFVRRNKHKIFPWFCDTTILVMDRQRWDCFSEKKKSKYSVL